MLNKKINIGIYAISYLVCLHVSEAHPQLVPTRGLTPYEKYRQEIINLGWEPKPVAVSDYVPGWPEIICGNRICSATFISPNRKEILRLSVWFVMKPGKIEYYVAPAFDIFDCSSEENSFQCQ